MTTAFGETSTADEVLEGIDLSGKHVVITGVSAGLGVETARALMARGAHVVGAARDLAKASKAIEPAIADARKGGSIELVQLDLASIASVRACTDAFVATGQRFDVVINNAGVASTPFNRTVDGFELQFATNHLGHFEFASRVAELIVPGGRLVVLGSAAHRFSDIDLDDLNWQRTPYDADMAYGRSKTATLLFAVEFDRRHRDRGVRAVSVHPGVIKTELARHLDLAALNTMLDELNERKAAAGERLFAWKSIPQGAATTVWAGFVAAADAVGGRYCENCHIAQIIDEGQSDPTMEGLYAYAVNPERALALWRESERLLQSLES
ncbi:NAD(P)-dependent dehydrogenase, short-chain alcohol dehydrogenase family [Sphingobium sp. AP50]|uniref:SDR family NAD(P)-dependent oxidoreductase n=1 Tax=Sphingobium sp. AP50 TaxID=1884369 RepID=UPI0008B0D0A1|nr:SDR family NAD(P)-dependent oxidoreductase [Sphingobium sp. AP50]SEK00832.1 NAD(P)-dependent dehydrogenase, short-chain alcohol dehydrogenase family [Sphingobium sp. AP50]